MGDFIHAVLSSIEFLFPFRIVHQWEQGGYYIFGRFWKTVGPGCYFVVPFFTWLSEVSVVPYMVATPRLDVTLLDGKNLSFYASAWAQVVDYNLAHNTVEDFQATTKELVEAVIADRLARVKPSRMEPENRADLLRDLTEWCNNETAQFGISISKVRFSTFVLNARTYRIIN